jgi:predicted CXXCH cytochrome family protein
MPVRQGPAGTALLIAGSATETCLSCHGPSLGRVLDGAPRTPPPERGPGNFIFLAEENLNDGSDGLSAWVPGERAGHNLQAPGYGLQHDLRFTTSPGGDYPSDRLGCVSCHDPHGNGRYRLLYDAGQTTPDGFLYLYPAPEADGPGFADPPESRDGHVAYRAGWSLWCANCHGLYHAEGVRDFMHPVEGTLRGGIWAIYNAYDGTARAQDGDVLTAYLPEVPIQDPGTSTTSTEGAAPASEISCLSCHRAHASSAPASLRWDPQVLRLAQDGVISGSWPLPNPYGDPGQTSLCNKCHAMETRPHNAIRPCLDCHGRATGGGGGPGEPVILDP